MKNSYSIYYLFIVFFVIMICIPPLLRVTLPNENVQINNDYNTNDTDQNMALSKFLQCNFNENISNQMINVSIFTDYYEEKVTSIEIIYDLSSIKTTNLISDNPLLSELYKLKDISSAKYEKNENEEKITFDGNIYNEPKLQQYSKDINIQKIYYETLGFICNIRAY